LVGENVRVVEVKIANDVEVACGSTQSNSLSADQFAPAPIMVCAGERPLEWPRGASTARPPSRSDREIPVHSEIRRTSLSDRASNNVVPERANNPRTGPQIHYPWLVFS
jgi:hypothetical protein